MDFEIRLIEFIQAGRSPFFDLAFQIISYIGSAFGLIAVGLILLCYKRKLCFWYVLTYGFVFLINNVLVKNLVHRVRPFVASDTIMNIGDKVTDFSFPSGHMACAVTIAIFLGYFLFQYFHKTSTRFGIVLCLCVYIGLVALSRMYLGKHYLTDLLGGMAIAGVICALGLVCMWLYHKKKGQTKK